MAATSTSLQESGSAPAPGSGAAPVPGASGSPGAAPSHHTFSAPAEDYAKVIYSLTHGEEQVASTSHIAERLGLTAGSVSTMLKRMDTAGLVEYAPYRGVRLTDAGLALALTVVRRHRLLELFLAQSLDIPWEDVDRFADALEHAASNELIELIATKLGNPSFDQHGDPIPTRELQINDRDHPTVAELPSGQSARIVRVSDSNPAMLRYLTEQSIGIGDHIEMVGRQPFDGPFDLLVSGRALSLGPPLANAIQVEFI